MSKFKWRVDLYLLALKASWTVKVPARHAGAEALWSELLRRYLQR